MKKRKIVEIPHKGKTITFPVSTPIEIYQVLKSNEVRSAISAETASLVYDAFLNSKIKDENTIKNILEESFLYEFTGNIFLPSVGEKKKLYNGVILVDNPPIVNGRLEQNIDFSNMIKEGNPSVRYISFKYKTGEQTWQELEKNPYIVGRYGEERAAQVAKVASTYKENPKIQHIESIDEGKIVMSILSSEGDRCLKIGFTRGNFRNCDGYAFGILKEQKN